MVTNTETVYNQIATHFSQTRYKIWPSVKTFLNSLNDDAYILDAGCGNGKNMLETQHKFYGIDMSDELLKIAKQKTVNLQNVIGFEQMSIVNMNTIKDNIFDAVMSIAVIHHLTTHNDRINAIKELIRVCKKNGHILFTVWQLENNETYNDGKTIYGDKDDHNKIILWTDSKTGQVFERFYHFFSFTEIIELVEQINNECKREKMIKSCQMWIEANNYYVKFSLC